MYHHPPFNPIIIWLMLIMMKKTSGVFDQVQAICPLVSLHIAIHLPLTYIVNIVIITFPIIHSSILKCFR